ncbi:rho GTPase-activating protein 22-like [Xyrichtys novacula]|nr:rho GTPase-activating protein 22-like [Xyrichtys novacula]
MSCQNLATVFGPNILRAKAEDPQSIMGGAALVHVLMLELIREQESLFARAPPSISARPPLGLRASPGALRQPHLHPVPCHRQLSLPLITERSRETGQPAAEAQDQSCTSSTAKADLPFSQKRLLGHRYTSSHPENCFYPPPTSSQPQHNVDFHQHHAGQRSTPAKASAATVEVQDPQPHSSKSKSLLMDLANTWPETDAGLWCTGAGETEVAVPGTASGGSSDAQDDSILSVYDNLDGSCPREGLAEIGRGHFETDCPEGFNETCGEEAWHTRDSFSSWSSCEVLPLDKSRDDEDKSSPDVSPKRPKNVPSGQISEDENNEDDENEDMNSDSNEDDEDEDEDDDAHPNSPASGLLLSPLSTGSSEVFLPSGPPDVQEHKSESESRDAHLLLAELQRQMARQKAEYQARIQRLERCNDILERQVAVLRVSLEQQKRSQSVAEIKIRNMERAKADADLRNTTLQREMDMFFQMYGEYRRGDEGRGGGSL